MVQTNYSFLIVMCMCLINLHAEDYKFQNDNDLDVEELCISTKSKYYPSNEHFGKNVTIVHHGEHLQAIDIEVCNNGTSHYCSKLNPNYISKCEQANRPVELRIVYWNNTVEKKEVNISSHCICKIVKK